MLPLGFHPRSTRRGLRKMPDFLIESDEFGDIVGDILQKCQRLRFKVRGGSMRPFIKDEDIVEVQKVPLDNLTRGDVVLCRLIYGRLVVHRVIRANQEHIWIQGDALLYPDGSIPRANVLGRIVALTRNGKHFDLSDSKTTLLVSGWLALAPARRFLTRLLLRFRRGIYESKSTLRCEFKPHQGYFYKFWGSVYIRKLK